MTVWAFVRFTFVDPFRFAFGCQFVLQNRLAIFARSSLQIAVPNFTESAAFFARPVRRIE